MADLMQTSAVTLGNDGQEGITTVISAAAVLTYENTNELPLVTTPQRINKYKNLIAEITVLYTGNPNDVDLTFGMATSNIELTGANAIANLDSAYWATKVIDLNTSGGTGTEYYTFKIAQEDIKGKFVYFKYKYEGDPGNDPNITFNLNYI